MKAHPDGQINLEISTLYRKFITDHTMVEPLVQIIHKLTRDNRVLRAQDTALDAASKKRLSTAGTSSLHSERALYASKFTTVKKIVK